MRGRTESERSCILTRTVKAPGEMIRFVVGPDGTLVPDLRARLPGRGAWVTATRDSVAEALRKGLFRRAFKASALQADPGLADAIEAALRQDLRQSLALANKAGAVVAGFAKVEAAIAGKPGIAALIHAREATADGRRKLAAALRRASPDTISGHPVFDDLSGDELDMALGRDHVIHAALVAGAGSTGCLARWRRLRTYRGEGSRGATGTAFTHDGAPDPGRGGGGGIPGGGASDAGVEDVTRGPEGECAPGEEAGRQSVRVETLDE